MITIVIPNWNGADYLRPCLESLQKQTEPAQIIVVDNGSTDESIAIIERDFKKVHIIKLDRNYGFAGGVNAGIEEALAQGAEYVALLNNDAVAEPDWLKNLVKTLKKAPKAGIVTSKFLRMGKGKVIDSTGDFYSIWGTPFPRGRDEADTGQYDTPELRMVPAASGGASLYRAQMLKQVGLFDERFFAYYEDVDISLRAQLAGWRVLYEPTAIAHHHVGKTSERMVPDFSLYHMYKNFVFLFIKNMPGKLFWRYGWRIKGVYLFKNLQLFKKLKFGLLLKLNLVIIWNLPGLIRARRYIQSHRTISVDYFDSLLTHTPPPTQAGLIKLTKKLHLK